MKEKEEDMLVDRLWTSFGSFLHSFFLLWELLITWIPLSLLWCLGGLRACPRSLCLDLWVVCTDAVGLGFV